MTTVETVSPAEIESTRKLGARNESEILRAVARVTQAHVADCMGVSASTISRALDDLNRWALLLAAAGLQVNPVDSMVVDAH
ncbi:MarR family transcriptional regulator, partial [Burkholderia multivorans]